jgi:hypothetical protein|uniref:Uncharacterized protein n=1 Tax=Zea mays TaxID=4577 RepID=C0PL65_MAIZE|nr:unknown [Zea mays]
MSMSSVCLCLLQSSIFSVLYFLLALLEDGSWDQTQVNIQTRQNVGAFSIYLGWQQIVCGLVAVYI